MIILFAFTIYGSVKEDAEESIKNITNSKDIEFVKYELDSETKNRIENKSRQRFFGSFIYKWKVYDSDTLKNIVLLDNVLGKTQPISFIVMFDKCGKIVHCEVIKYREDHGGQVQDKGWLKQFLGKNNESSFIVGKDIDNISGATISTNSMSRGIYKLSLLFEHIIDE